MRTFRIGTRTITDSSPCYVIAELGNNHGGDIALASRMIAAAAACGANAVKFQTRCNETLYSPTMLAQPYEHEHSFGKTYGEHRAALELSQAELRLCKLEVERHGLDFLSTAFDEASASLLEDVGVDAFKIHSGGATDAPLLRSVSAYGRPVVLSTGGCTTADIEQAVSILRERLQPDLIAVLHCTAAYPVRDWMELNLRCVETLCETYPDLVVGYSGHDNGIAMPIAAAAIGARIVEKHFTLDRSSKGTDHSFSLEPVGLKKMCRDLMRLHLALGDGKKVVYASEHGPIGKMRRHRQADGSCRITGRFNED